MLEGLWCTKSTEKISRFFHDHCQTHTIRTVYSLYKPAELLMWREIIHRHTKLSFCQTLLICTAFLCDAGFITLLIICSTVPVVSAWLC